MKEDVQLINSMGNDLMVVNAARVSMAKESKVFSDADAKLIRFLARHHHWTPFGHVMLQFRIRMPIFIARQWYKSTVGLLRNEESRRYVDHTPEFFVPEVWRKQAENVKQGSSDEPVDYQRYITREVEEFYRASVQLYQAFLEQGVCREQARMLLPQAMYTEFVETGSLYAYARICKQRLDSHAQKETGAYAEQIATYCAEVAPVAWQALMELD